MLFFPYLLVLYGYVMYNSSSLSQLNEGHTVTAEQWQGLGNCCDARSAAVIRWWEPSLSRKVQCRSSTIQGLTRILVHFGLMQTEGGKGKNCETVAEICRNVDRGCRFPPAPASQNLIQVTLLKELKNHPRPVFTPCTEGNVLPKGS